MRPRFCIVQDLSIRNGTDYNCLCPPHTHTQNLYNNFGEIGGRIKELMEEFQTKSQSTKKIESIADMKVGKRGRGSLR